MSEPEFTNSSHVPEVSSIASAYGEIVKHNNQRSGFGSLFSNIFNLLPIEELPGVDYGDETPALASAQDIYTGVRDKFEEQVTEGDMEGEVLELVHNDLFMRAGVEIAPIGGHIASTSGTRATSTELLPIVRNSMLLNDFLNEAKPEDTEIDGFSPFVDAVLGTLDKQVQLAFDPAAIGDGSDDQVLSDEVRGLGEDALRTYVTIEDQLKRLGLDKSYSAKRLQEYLEYWGNDILPEFFVADSTGVLRDVNSNTFGPSEWQRDASPEFLSSRWNQIIKAIEYAKSNPKAQDFAKELVNRATAHLRFAQKDFKKLEKQYNTRQVRKSAKRGESVLIYGTGFTDIFNDVATRLIELAS